LTTAYVAIAVRLARDLAWGAALRAGTAGNRVDLFSKMGIPGRISALQKPDESGANKHHRR